MSEWLAVEAIVRQREKEKNDKALAKISAENKRKGVHVAGKHVSRQTELDNGDMDNDVFDDQDFSDISDPGMDFDDDIMMGIQEEKDSGNCEDEEDPMEGDEDEYLKNERLGNTISEENLKDDKDFNEINDNEINLKNTEEEPKEIKETEKNEEKISKQLEENKTNSVQEDKLEEEKTKELIKEHEYNEEIPEGSNILQVAVEEPSFDEGNVVLELDENEPLSLQEHCFAESEPEQDQETGVTPDQGGMLLLSIKSSPSTSSYETVGNEFTEILEMAHNDGIPIDENVAEVAEMLTDDKDNDEHFEQAKLEDGEEEAIEAFELNDDDDEHENENNENLENDNSTRKYHSVEDVREMTKMTHAVIITEAASNDALECTDEPTEETSRKTSLISPMNEDITVVASLDALQEPKSACVSPASSNGGVYSVSLMNEM